MKLNGVYLIKYKTGIKFGRTSDFKIRFRAYGGCPWAEIEAVYFMWTLDSYSVEKRLKKQMKKYITVKGSREFLKGADINEVLQELWDARHFREPGMRKLDCRTKNHPILQFSFKGSVLGKVINKVYI